MKTRRHFMKSIAATSLGGLGVTALPDLASEEFKLPVNPALPLAQKKEALRHDRVMLLYKARKLIMYAAGLEAIHPERPNWSELRKCHTKAHRRLVYNGYVCWKKHYEEMMEKVEVQTRPLAELLWQDIQNLRKT